MLGTIIGYRSRAIGPNNRIYWQSSVSICIYTFTGMPQTHQIHSS